jgi:rhodanese-related sulfurtransferase
MNTISPQELHRRIEQDPNVRMLDVRTPSEHSALHVPGVVLEPLGSLDPEAFLREHGNDTDSPLYVLCESGIRARSAIEAFEQAGFRSCVLVQGGTAAWAAAGLPVNRGASRGLPLMRQVQATAGSLILLGALLGWQVQPAWFGLCAFVGAGLTMAGLTGFCPMALLLAKMPWNTRAGTPAGGTANPA